MYESFENYGIDGVVNPEIKKGCEGQFCKSIQKGLDLPDFPEVHEEAGNYVEKYCRLWQRAKQLFERVNGIKDYLLIFSGAFIDTDSLRRTLRSDLSNVIIGSIPENLILLSEEFDLDLLRRLEISLGEAEASIECWREVIDNILCTRLQNCGSYGNYAVAA